MISLPYPYLQNKLINFYQGVSSNSGFVDFRRIFGLVQKVPKIDET